MKVRNEKINQLVEINVTEDEFLDVLTRLNKKFAVSFAFGQYDKDDIEQEIAKMCLKALPDWDGRHLYSFLFAHTYNRLINLKRDEFYRAECPCSLCTHKEDGQTGHVDGKHCVVFLEWKSRNAHKANISCPNSIPDLYDNESDEISVMDKICNEELSDYIDIRLPVELRGSYLKMKSGIRISKKSRDDVLIFLRGLLNVN